MIARVVGQVGSTGRGNRGVITRHVSSVNCRGFRTRSGRLPRKSRVSVGIQTPSHVVVSSSVRCRSRSGLLPDRAPMDRPIRYRRRTRSVQASRDRGVGGNCLLIRRVLRRVPILNSAGQESRRARRRRTQRKNRAELVRGVDCRQHARGRRRVRNGARRSVGPRRQVVVIVNKFPSVRRYLNGATALRVTHGRNRGNRSTSGAVVN